MACAHPLPSKLNIARSSGWQSTWQSTGMVGPEAVASDVGLQDLLAYLPACRLASTTLHPDALCYARGEHHFHSSVIPPSRPNCQGVILPRMRCRTSTRHLLGRRPRSRGLPGRCLAPYDQPQSAAARRIGICERVMAPMRQVGKANRLDPGPEGAHCPPSLSRCPPCTNPTILSRWCGSELRCREASPARSDRTGGQSGGVRRLCRGGR